MNNRLRKHRMTVVEVFGLTRPAWPSRQSQIRFRGRIDGIKPGEVLARISHQDRVVIAPGGVDRLGEGRKA